MTDVRGDLPLTPRRNGGPFEKQSKGKGQGFSWWENPTAEISKREKNTTKNDRKKKESKWAGLESVHGETSKRSCMLKKKKKEVRS